MRAALSASCSMVYKKAPSSMNATWSKHILKKKNTKKKHNCGSGQEVFVGMEVVQALVVHFYDCWIDGMLSGCRKSPLNITPPKERSCSIDPTRSAQRLSKGAMESRPGVEQCAPRHAEGKTNPWLNFDLTSALVRTRCTATKWASILVLLDLAALFRSLQGYFSSIRGRSQNPEQNG